MHYNICLPYLYIAEHETDILSISNETIIKEKADLLNNKVCNTEEGNSPRLETTNINKSLFVDCCTGEEELLLSL